MTAEESYNHALLREVLEAANVCLPDTHAIVVIVTNLETGHTSTATDLEQEDLTGVLESVLSRADDHGPDGDIVTLKVMAS
jgi:hypothetical protein